MPSPNISSVLPIVEHRALEVLDWQDISEKVEQGFL